MKLLTSKSITSKPVLQNIVWLFFDKVLRMGVGVVVGVWVARYLGPDQFGILNYALAFVAIIGSVASLGIDNIVVKEIISSGTANRKLLGTAFLLRLAGSMVSVAVIVLLSLLAEGSGSVSFIVIFIISFTLVFQTFDVIDLYYQAHLLSRRTVIAKNTAFILASGIKVFFIVYEYSLIYFALATLFEFGLSALLLVYSLQIKKIRIQFPVYKAEVAKNLLKQSWPLIFAALSVILYMRIDQIMIRYMLDAAAVGQYSAAVRLTEVWFFLPSVIVSSVVPSLVKSLYNYEDYEKKLVKLYSLLIYLSLALSLVVTLLSSFLINMLYGEAYQEAGFVLKIHVWSCIFVFLGVASSQQLLIEDKTKISLYRTAFGVTCNILLNFMLVPAMGINGAAVATLASYFVSSVLSNGFFSKARHINTMYLKSLNIMKALKQNH